MLVALARFCGALRAPRPPPGACGRLACCWIERVSVRYTRLVMLRGAAMARLRPPIHGPTYARDTLRTPTGIRPIHAHCAGDARLAAPGGYRYRLAMRPGLAQSVRRPRGAIAERRGPPTSASSSSSRPSRSISPRFSVARNQVQRNIRSISGAETVGASAARSRDGTSANIPQTPVAVSTSPQLPLE